MNSQKNQKEVADIVAALEILEKKYKLHSTQTKKGEQQSVMLSEKQFKNLRDKIRAYVKKLNMN